MMLFAGIGFAQEFASADTPKKGSSREVANAAVMQAEEPHADWEERDVPKLASAQKHPNIHWLTCEDISPYLGCYGF
ncbi:hypothetical protein RRSWK_03631 [Rhodopirellula sp. SWK7]|nr:hypothetical protein RRSWK_03631 [Rhodopirellula sp. SWK7]